MKAFFVGVLLTIILSDHDLKAQQNLEWYTWNPDSTIVYDRPDPEAEIIRKVAYGTRLRNVEILKETELVSLSLGREFEGELPYQNYFMSVTDSTGTGYVLRDQISKLPPMQRRYDGFESTGKYMKRIWPEFEEFQKSSEVPIRDYIFTKEVDSVAFRGKDYYTVTKFDSCVDYEYYSENWSYLEVFQVLSTSLYIGNDRMIMSKISINSIDDGVFDLGNGLSVQDVYIKQNEAGNWLFGYYGCD